MAPALPKQFALYSSQCDKYLAYVPDDGMIRGFLKFSAEDFRTDLTKFEVVESKSGEGLVHIKCSYNNKYWRRWSPNKFWIAADADVPDENQSKWSCTLFKPVFVNGDATTLQLKHVQLNRNAFSSGADYEPYTYCLSTTANPRDMNKVDIFKIIDLAPSLPEEEKPEQPLKRPEDGKPTKRPEDTKPSERPEDDNTDGQTHADEHSSEGNKSPIKKYEIIDVKFDLNEAKFSYLYDDYTPVPVRNDDEESQEMELLFHYDKVETNAWKSLGENSTIKEINTDVVTELRSAIPVMVDKDTVLLGPEFRGPYQWGEELNSHYKIKSRYKAILPGKTRLVVILYAKRANITVPFSYTRSDIHVNGAKKTHKNLKGQYGGINVYSLAYKLTDVEASDSGEKRNDLVE